MRLDGKVAAVTGGGSGIGRAICMRLAAEGARVAALDIDLAGAQETVDAAGGGLALVVDVSDSAAVDAAIAEVERSLGPLDILVNNAGAVGGAHLRRVTPLLETQRAEQAAGRVKTPLEALVRITDDEWRQLLAVHLDGTFHGTRAAARAMAPRGHGGDRQHGVGLRHRGVHRPPALLRGQGRHHRLHALGRQGAHRPGRPCERARAGPRRHAQAAR